MEDILFTADRFKNKTGSNAALDNDDNNKTETNKLDQLNHQNVNPKTPTTSNNNLGMIFDSQYYSICNKYNKFPSMNSDETIINFDTVTDSIAILITSARILVYNYKANDVNSHMFEFSYLANSYNIPPLCTIIPNPVNSLKPDLVILDPITGLLNFFESIKLSPSLSILKTIIKEKISLYNAEFFNDIQLFHDTAILLTTSQKRVFYVTFKDQFGDVSIVQNQIYNNRPLISFMLSKSYSIREYNNSNRIVSIKTFDVSPVSRSIIILESTGHVAFINHLKGSSNFTLEASFDLDTILPLPNSKFIDLEFIKSKNIGIFLFENNNTGSMSNLFLDFNNMIGAPKVLVNTLVPLISESELIVDAEICLLNDGETLLVKNDHKLIIFDPNFENLASPWSEAINFNEKLGIYSWSKIDFTNSTIYLSSDKGIIEFCFKKAGKSNDLLYYVKEEILQYLKYYSSDSPVIFDLEKSNLPIQQSTIRNAIMQILDELLQNKSTIINKSEAFTTRNLNERINLAKKLVVFVSENYQINDDEELTTEILNTCELLSLSAEFYDLCITRDLVPIVEIVLKTMKYSGSFQQFVKSNSNEILILIAAYVEYINDKIDENNIIQLSILLKDLFIAAFLQLDDYIKKYLNGWGLSNVFISHFELLTHINDITRKIYNISCELENENNLSMLNETLLGLSCFLYYSINQIVIYLESHNNSENDLVTLKLFKDLLNKNKNKWIYIFIASNKQNDIVPLVLKYEDLSSLSSLVDSKRNMIQMCYENQEIGDIEYTNSITDVEFEFDHYFEVFGYKFAESLFEFYIKSNKTNIMLSNFEKYSDFLDQFVSNHPDYYNFLWIHDIKTNKIGDVSNNLLNYLSNNKSSSLNARKFQSSLGKLVSVCDNGSNNSSQKNFCFESFNSSLLLISLQEEIYSKLFDLNLLEDLDEKISKQGYLMDNGLTYLADEAGTIVNKIKNRISINVTDIITFVTLFTLARFQFDNDSRMINDDNDQSESNEATDNFIISTVTKILKLLDSYTDIGMNKNNNLLYAANDNAKLKCKIWKKLLFRRIISREDMDDIIRKIYVKNENLEDQTDVNITEDDLNSIGVSDQHIILDYKQENILLLN